ncbi:MAG: hypothetical protein G01um101493_353 [Microgenomates group bacterium Gr01-1014_93]|nr:MAG: hypothetical protein G01um101493_353 [Microgenomates group bacterium Gr01-1014_93]
MRTAYFIYFEDNEKDAELLNGLRHWLPSNIGIQKAKIEKGELKTLDEKLISNIPLGLENEIKPIYLTDEGLAYLKNIDIMFKAFKGKGDASQFINQMKTERKLIIGRVALTEFIENLKKYSP